MAVIADRKEGHVSRKDYTFNLVLVVTTSDMCSGASVYSQCLG